MPATPCDLVLVGAAEVISAPTRSAPLCSGTLDELAVMLDTSVAVADGRVIAIGPTKEIAAHFDPTIFVDASNSVVSAGLIDPHTHLIHGGSRHTEYEAIVTGNNDATVDRLQSGVEYTIEMTQRTSLETLRTRALADLDDMLSLGTTTVEAKSGYGSSPDEELRILRLLGELNHPISIERTYLGAHVAPVNTPRDTYVRSVIDTLAQARRLADWCDVFCDPAGFTVAETRKIALAAIEHGFKIRLHADQTGDIGASALAAELGAASADHLDRISDAGIDALARAGTVGVVLPTVALHMLEAFPAAEGEKATAPKHSELADRVHAMLDGGVALALSTDYNPGSSPCLSMQLVMQLAMRLFRLSYSQVWSMATANAAHALGLGDDRGTIAIGRRADLVVWDVPNHEMVIHRFGSSHTRHVVKDGRLVYSANKS